MVIVDYAVFYYFIGQTENASHEPDHLEHFFKCYQELQKRTDSEENSYI